MKKLLISFFIVCVYSGHAQKVFQLYSGKPKGSETWTYTEKETYSESIKRKIVYNVSQPTLTLYAPAPSRSNGTAIIICPGGAFGFLSVESEGTEVAKWLNARNITAFILKYRVAETTTADPAKEVFEKINNGQFMTDIGPVIPYSIDDGSEAVKYVRAHAEEFKINPSRIGIMGFSAGGTVGTGATKQT
jgi:acetyl esterase/lipase